MIKNNLNKNLINQKAIKKTEMKGRAGQEVDKESG